MLPVLGSTISMGPNRLRMDSGVHCLKVSGPRSKKMCSWLDDGSFSIVNTLMVMSFVYLHREAPDGSLSVNKHW